MAKLVDGVRRKLFDGFVAGFRYGDCRGDATRIIWAKTAELVPEPSNPHDRNAIAVELRAKSGRLHLGYVPRVSTGPIHGALKKGLQLAVKLDVRPEARLTYERVHLIIEALGNVEPRKPVVRKILLP